MGDVFSAVPAAMAAFSAASSAAGDTITSAGSADSAAMLAAAFAAIGPIGVLHYHPALASAVCNNLAATLLIGQVHHANSGAVDGCTNAFVAADNA